MPCASVGSVVLRADVARAAGQPCALAMCASRCCSLVLLTESRCFEGQAAARAEAVSELLKGSGGTLYAG